MSKLLQDINGNTSSKRLFGAVLLASGLLFSAILFGFSLFTGASDSHTAISVINMLLIAGGGLLGIGVFEKGIAAKK